jgi:hypothetical protein
MLVGRAHTASPGIATPGSPAFRVYRHLGAVLQIVWPDMGAGADATDPLKMPARGMAVDEHGRPKSASYYEPSIVRTVLALLRVNNRHYMDTATIRMVRVAFIGTPENRARQYANTQSQRYENTGDGSAPRAHPEVWQFVGRCVKQRHLDAHTRVPLVYSAIARANISGGRIDVPLYARMIEFAVDPRTPRDVARRTLLSMYTLDPMAIPPAAKRALPARLGTPRASSATRIDSYIAALVRAAEARRVGKAALPECDPCAEYGMGDAPLADVFAMCAPSHTLCGVAAPNARTGTECGVLAAPSDALMDVADDAAVVPKRCVSEHNV